MTIGNVQEKTDQHPQHRHSTHSMQHSQASSQRKQQHSVIKLNN
jgi:hypothetical protein